LIKKSLDRNSQTNRPINNLVSLCTLGIMYFFCFFRIKNKFSAALSKKHPAYEQPMLITLTHSGCKQFRFAVKRGVFFNLLFSSGVTV